MLITFGSGTEIGCFGSPMKSKLSHTEFILNETTLAILLLFFVV